MCAIAVHLSVRLSPFLCRFAMAEQALNTIYLLGEQPDVLCSRIIHQLHSRVFNRPLKADDQMSLIQTDEEPAAPTSQPDATDATHLAQLVFVVGHVAIKHIVYLELVEREVKRQKDESNKG
jgi:condensin complex subunit 1